MKRIDQAERGLFDGLTIRHGRRINAQRVKRIKECRDVREQAGILRVIERALDVLKTLLQGISALSLQAYTDDPLFPRFQFLIQEFF